MVSLKRKIVYSPEVNKNGTGFQSYVFNHLMGVIPNVRTEVVSTGYSDPGSYFVYSWARGLYVSSKTTQSATIAAYDILPHNISNKVIRFIAEA